RGDLGARLERGDQHVERRREEDHREEDEEHVRPDERPAALAPQALGLHASFPRRLMSRRMKYAATPRIGNMKSETQAPSGRSPPSMPSWNAQVAKTCVWSIGPPAVRMRTMSKLAKVTMSENSTVMAMMLRIIGSVTYQIFCHQFAPSIAAASESCSGTDLRAGRHMIRKQGAPAQTVTRIPEER